MAQPKKTLKDYLLPHSGNGHKPLFFTGAGVAIVISGLLLLHAAYVLQTLVVFTQTNFMASVLPGVLSTLTNDDREKNGVAALTPDPLLAEAAQLKANDMAEKGYFSHVDPSGNAPWYWLDQVGYSYTYAGENLAVDFKDSEDVEEAWMNSPTHRANIVKPQYTRIGIGTAEGEYKGKKTTFVVQFFATPRAGPTLGGGVGSLGAGTGQVLGAEIETLDAQFVSFMSQVAASPTHTYIYLLLGLLGAVVFLLIIALIAHARVQYIEVIGAAFVIISIVLGVLVYVVLSSSEPVVPEGSGATNTIVIE
ncbi:CAP domain-containing protein [Patescibacteria group bacterium]|nr:CAP domain-containing protein [Patescibacteria group bacterium]MBU1500479.1 CAP domain-containing protein [Patescibacteria group bacterium]MBU2080723.1 CAP domain-containing protein [Patescibacteria group bacterium]MBU2123828.1 CAP domain-containing protein [Patescibacteria group bacterium]MBU2194881.1 CAP domain-containing protein [Patescibacteria group bacterium]